MRKPSKGRADLSQLALTIRSFFTKRQSQRGDKHDTMLLSKYATDS